ncbi:MAG: FtsX-like permease family protein [Gemmatimonadetes bacterium]|nr:MAG: FtsX-like permease family protein [Gemmatimonadota bacterium]
MAYGAVQVLLAVQPPIPIDLNFDIRVDRSVLLFTAGVSLLAGLLFGLAPALQSTNPDVAPTLRDEGGAVVGGGRGWSLRGALIVAQVALSFVLLVGAGLFLRSLQKAQRIDPGFDTSPAAVLWTNLEMSGVSPDEGPALLRTMRERLAGIPGLQAVAVADRLPMGAEIRIEGVLPEGVEPPAGRDDHDVDVAVVDGAYFRVMGVPMLRGRAFDAADGPDTRPVVVVSQAFVDRFWPGEAAVGRTITSGNETFTVVGVARDTKVRTLGEAPRPYVYFNADQRYPPAPQFVLRGTLPAARLVAEGRRALREVRDDIVLLEAKTMDEHLALMLFPPRAIAALLGAFGLVALLLSGVGIYGLVSYSVARRTREVGLRLALGADPGRVVRHVVAGGMRTVVAGAVLGLAASAAVTGLLARFLYGVNPLDLATFAGIALVLGGVALGAAYVPALRASRVDPVAALRSD